MDMRQSIKDLFIGMIWRFIVRLFFVPSYAFIIAPWFVTALLVFGEDSPVMNFAYLAVSYLAGKPGAENLNEGDLAVALFAVFAAINVVIEIVRIIRRTERATDQHRANKRRLVTQLVIMYVGWLAFIPAGVRAIGLVAVLLAIIFPLACSAGPLIEYTFRELYARWRRTGNPFEGLIASKKQG